MKRVLAASILLALSPYAGAADLLEVYQTALLSSPIVAANLATQNVAEQQANVSRAAYLPNITLTGGVSEAKASQGNYQARTYQAQLTQVVFDVNTLATWRANRQLANAADSTYQYQLQQFIQTVSQDYFNVLQAEDNVSFAEAKEQFLSEAMKQTQQKFVVGLATIADVKDAEAQYELAKADRIKKASTLADAKETLAAIAGQHFDNLAILKENFPFTNPGPTDINFWVTQAERGNWNLSSQRLTTLSDRDKVVAASGSMLPQVSFQATYARNAYSGNSFAAAGLNSGTDRSIALTFTWDIFQAAPVSPSAMSPGPLWSLAARSLYTYEAQQATEDAFTRGLISQTRQDYLSVLADVRSVAAYKQAVISGAAALDQAEAQYRVGTITVTDVLKQVQYLYQDKYNYAAARYQYINDLIQLKLDSGTLAITDLASINNWLQA